MREGRIRTPLPALTTFLDDPLRVLRAVRFASRCVFALDTIFISLLKRAKLIMPICHYSNLTLGFAFRWTNHSLPRLWMPRCRCACALVFFPMCTRSLTFVDYWYRAHCERRSAASELAKNSTECLMVLFHFFSFYHYLIFLKFLH